MGETRSLIEMRGIIKRFYVGQPHELEILHGIDLDVREGEFVAIVGASGSGKSTLMNVIGVLDRPTLGSYFLDGTVVEDAADIVDLFSHAEAVAAIKAGKFFFSAFLPLHKLGKYGLSAPADCPDCCSCGCRCFAFTISTVELYHFSSPFSTTPNIL